MQQSHTFTPARDAEVLLDTPGSSALQWQLLDDQDEPLTEPATLTKGNTFEVTAGTTYRIAITVAPERTTTTSATYSFTLRDQTA